MFVCLLLAKLLRGRLLAPSLLALCLLRAAPVAAQACPWPGVCTYVPPLPPPAPPGMADPVAQVNVLTLAAPEGATSFQITSNDLRLPDYGVDAADAAFLPIPRGYNVASDFGVAESSGIFSRSVFGYPMVLQQQRSGGVANTARLRGHTSGLGRRFRLAGFALQQSNGDDAGFDFFGVYAPQDCNVVATLPAAAYARFVAAHPGKNFWPQGPGPTVSLHLPAQKGAVVRTRGAARAVGARGFPIDGTLVQADAPISVSVGGRGWAFGADGNALGGDDGIDGTVDIAYLGTQYVVSDFVGSPVGQLRVVADADDTDVSINGSRVATLAAGETYAAATPRGVSFVETGHKAAVYQSTGLFGASADLALVQPVAFAAVANNDVVLEVYTGEVGYAFVVLPTSKSDTLRLNGATYTLLRGAKTSTVPGHPEWTAVLLPNLVAGQQLLEAQTDLSVALLTGRVTSSGSSFAFMSRLRRPNCGNGVLDPGESCDDGNVGSFDGCNSMCIVEPGFSCAGVPSACALLASADRPDAQTSGSAVPTAPIDCLGSGCAPGTWCDSLGCVPQLHAAAYCTEAAQCLAGVCAADGQCGTPAGEPCAQDAACRGGSCQEQVCVQADATGEGAGLSSCAGDRRPRSPRLADAVGPVALLVAYAARRRARRRLRALLFLAALASPALNAAPASSAPVDGFALNPLPTPQPASPYLVVDAAAVPGESHLDARHALALRLNTHVAHRPLQVSGGRPRRALGAVVARQVEMRLGVSYGFRRRLRVGLSLPVQVDAQGARVFSSPVAYPAPRRAGLGDASASAAWVVWRSAGARARLAVAAELRLPTGRRAAYAGDAAVGGALSALASGRWRRLQLAATVGPWIRAGSRGAHPRRAGDGWQLAGAVAAELWGPRLQLALELPLSVATKGARPAYAARDVWFDPLLSLRWRPHPGWHVFVGAGSGTTRVRGEARWRLLAAVEGELASGQRPGAAPDAPSPRQVSAPLPPVAAPSPRQVSAPLPPIAAPAQEPTQSTDATPAAVVPAPSAPVATPTVAETLATRVHFALENHDLDRTARAQLRVLAAELRARQGLVVVWLRAYTDATGTDPYNLTLSLRRAEHVRRYLVANGVAADKLRVEARGATEFRGDNAKRGGRSENRRVEFVVVVPEVTAAEP